MNKALDAHWLLQCLRVCPASRQKASEERLYGAIHIELPHAGEWRAFLSLLVQAEESDESATARSRSLVGLCFGPPARSEAARAVGIYRKLLGSQAEI